MTTKDNNCGFENIAFVINKKKKPISKWTYE